MHSIPPAAALLLSLAAGLSLNAIDLPEDLAPQVVATGFTSLEGPAWSDPEQCLYFSDQAGDFGLYRFVPGEGASLVHDYANKVNGNLVLGDGSLITCESGNRRLVRRTLDGELTVLVDSYEGEPLNQPNDVVVKSDGTLWFTTPEWPTNDREFVFSYDPTTGELTKHVEGVVQPNGLAFSPDEQWFYLNSSGAEALLRFPVRKDESLGESEILIGDLNGGPDGMAIDREGNLFICVYNDRSPLGGLNIFSPEGTLLRHIDIPGATTNCAFGGRHDRELYITSGDSLYRLDLSGAYPEVSDPGQSEANSRFNTLRRRFHIRRR